jgi:hypothetical protein
MLHRIREFYSKTNAPFDGKVEVDENFSVVRKTTNTPPKN